MVLFAGNPVIRRIVFPTSSSIRLIHAIRSANILAV
jgi:hypothetical protein